VRLKKRLPVIQMSKDLGANSGSKATPGAAKASPPIGYDPGRFPVVGRLVEIQEGRAKRPWACRFGLHQMSQVRQLLTTGNAVCGKCGVVWMTSLFGDFDLSRAESADFLRKNADKLEPCA
jgi:hypothetical protein